MLSPGCAPASNTAADLRAGARVGGSVSGPLLCFTRRQPTGFERPPPVQPPAPRDFGCRLLERGLKQDSNLTSARQRTELDASGKPDSIFC